MFSIDTENVQKYMNICIYLERGISCLGYHLCNDNHSQCTLIS